MDVIGRQRQRRVGLDQVAIQLRPARHMDQADPFTRYRQIAVAKEIAQPQIGREDCVAHRRCRLRCQPRLVRVRKARRKILERPDIGRSVDAALQLQVELFDHIAHD